MGAIAAARLCIEKLTTGRIETQESYERGDDIPLYDKSVLIGRFIKEPGATLPYIKIIGDDYVTRGEHVEIFYDFKEEVYKILDTRSLNGTYLNHKLLEKNSAYPLKDRDLIGLAKAGSEIRVLFRFKIKFGTIPQWQIDDAQAPTKEGVYVNLASENVYVNGIPVSLTKTEFKLLKLLYENKKKAVSIDDISYEIWGEKGASNDQISHHIIRLRAKIGDDLEHPKYIVVVHSCYRLDL
jgi:pSer/pThr/pTyr-binding forkhead associated (FHA) protein